ncbi:hypothetical protein BDZ91DRAFT_738987 [Kalaharituber pfeilii]|nr:hypothetical protein BDZ91DRAFT_738987 [Kalaharituber pfeilii]
MALLMPSITFCFAGKLALRLAKEVIGHLNQKRFRIRKLYANSSSFGPELKTLDGKNMTAYGHVCLELKKS